MVDVRLFLRRSLAGTVAALSLACEYPDFVTAGTETRSGPSPLTGAFLVEADADRHTRGVDSRLTLYASTDASQGDIGVEMTCVRDDGDVLPRVGILGGVSEISAEQLDMPDEVPYSVNCEFTIYVSPSDQAPLVHWRAEASLKGPSRNGLSIEIDVL
jgi:hypothetical protein